MSELRYPIGIQTFSEIITEGYAYADKTRFISILLRQSKYVFLSRPRRFGKSLFISTLKAFFEGRRELFKGLDIDREDRDWTPSPVLHFDFNTGLYDHPEGLTVRLDTSLSVYEETYGIEPSKHSAETLPARFEKLIRDIHKQSGRKVVVLIDEYDKPLLGLDKFPEIFEKNQSMLKSFFGNLKSMDEFIRFGFLTGVARFNKVSIFSDLNHLDDISLEETFSDICGLTEEELTTTLRSGIEALALKRKEDYNATLNVLRNYYDGYLFTPEGSRLYNPYSVLLALKSKSVDPFWFETGSPTFLVEKIRNDRIDPVDINGKRFTKQELTQVGIDSRDPIPLMFQTGYLTIGNFDSDTERYTLRFPNREVEVGFAKELLPLYVKGSQDSSSGLSIFKFQDDLLNGNPEKFMERLSTALKNLPFEDQCESVYRAVTYLQRKGCFRPD